MGIGIGDHFLLYHGVQQLLHGLSGGQHAQQTEHRSHDHGKNHRAGYNAHAQTSKALTNALFVAAVLKDQTAQRLLDAKENDPGNKAQQEEHHGENHDGDDKDRHHQNRFLHQRRGVQNIAHHFRAAKAFQQDFAQGLAVDVETCHGVGGDRTCDNKGQDHGQNKGHQANNGLVQSPHQTHQSADGHNSGEENC